MNQDKNRTFKALRQIIMYNVPMPTLANRLSTVNGGICGVPHITLVNTHAERDGSTDLGITEPNASLGIGLGF